MESANKAFSILYRIELWLLGAAAREAGQLLRSFIKNYAWLAHSSCLRQKLRFGLTVKLHMLDHSARRLQCLGPTNSVVLNTISESVQMDEDFIGHCARISRRVSPITNAYRVCQRYLCRAAEVFKKRKRRKKTRKDFSTESSLHGKSG